jgi:DNA-binding SARP family transcriptional activator
MADLGNRRTRRHARGACPAAMHLALSELASATDADGLNSPLAPRDAVLLAWLALEGPTPRDRLAALLWPASETAVARTTLRQRLHRLKQQCGDLVAGGNVLRLADGVSHDLAQSEGLLGTTHLDDAPQLDAWLDERRQRRTGATRDALERQVQALEAASQWAQALPLAQALLRLDPLSEAAHRQLMRLHYLRGDRAAALLAFDACERVLKDEVGARPSAPTLALLSTIEQAQTAAWVAGQPLPAAVLRPPRLIGREAEAAAITNAWAAGEMFLLTGEAGLGKSRLLDALFEADGQVLVLRARPGDAAVPLATLVRLVHLLAERWPGTLAHPAHAQLLRLASGAENEPRAAVRPAAVLAAELLRSAQAAGLAGVVLDDLQFADDASVDAWHEALARPAPAALRLGFASRGAGAAALERIERLQQRSDLITIALTPLGPQQTQGLVESLGLADTDVASVAAALLQRIGGNPLHLLETIRHALEQHGRLVADRLDTPAQVLDLLEQRLTALSAEGLLIVRIAAIAGSDFSAELAQAVSRRDVLELADAWAALERQGILDARGFAHDLMLEAAARLLPQPIKRVLHARVAEAIAPRGPPPARLAHHWLQADDRLAALPHLLAAARLAWRAGRGRETREAFFMAADIEVGRGRPEVAFDILFECVEAVARLCPVADFDAVITRLSALAHTASHRARLALLQANSRYLHGDQTGSDRGMADALLLAIACGDKMVESECVYDQACRAMREGRIRNAVQLLSSAATLQRSIGLESLALSTEGAKRIALRSLGQLRAVVTEQQAGLPWLAEHGSVVDVATQRLDLVLMHTELGATGLADAGAPAAWRAVQETDMQGLEVVRNGLYMLRYLRLRGRWQHALEVDRELTQRLAALDHDAGELARERAALYLDLGRPELAQPFIETFENDPAFLEPNSWHAAGLRWRYQAAVAAHVDAQSTIATALASEQFPRVCELLLAAGQSCPQHLSAALLAPLVAGCEAEGLQIHLQGLRALQAWLLARDGAHDAAAQAAAAGVAALPGTDLGAALPACALWLAKALQGLGRAAQAAAITQQAAQWVLQRQADSVPAEFHASYRQRNPVHRELLALAQQLR